MNFLHRGPVLCHRCGRVDYVSNRFTEADDEPWSAHALQWLHPTMFFVIPLDLVETVPG